jgi:hypothetical protein
MALTARNTATMPPRPQRRAEPPALRAKAPASGDAHAIAATAVRTLKIDEGFYSLRIGTIPGRAVEISDLTLPMALISLPSAEEGEEVEIVASFPGKGPWIAQEGGTVILRSPVRGCHIIVTVYGQPEQQPIQLVLDLRRLDQPAGKAEKATTDDRALPNRRHRMQKERVAESDESTPHAMGVAMASAFGRATKVAAAEAHRAGFAIPGRRGSRVLEITPEAREQTIQEHNAWSPTDWKASRDS